MAAPTFGAAGTRLAGASGTTAPIAVPAGVVAGSVIVVCLTRVADGATVHEPLTLPSGFSLVTDNPGITSGTFHTLMVDLVVKRATGADTGTYDFSWATSRFRTGFAVRLDGCRTSGTPFEDDDGAVSTAASDSTPAVTVDTLGPDRLLVWAGWSWAAGAWTQPAGYTPRVTDVPFDLITLATKEQAAAGSSGAVSGSQVSEAKAAWLGAFLADATVVTGTAAAALGGLTATAVGERETAASPASGGWWSYLSIVREARQLAADEQARPPAACPTDGEPLRTGPDGRLFCRFDGWRPDSGLAE